MLAEPPVAQPIDLAPVRAAMAAYEQAEAGLRAAIAATFPEGSRLQVALSNSGQPVPLVGAVRHAPAPLTHPSWRREVVVQLDIGAHPIRVPLAVILHGAACYAVADTAADPCEERRYVA